MKRTNWLQQTIITSVLAFGLVFTSLAPGIVVAQTSASPLPAVDLADDLLTPDSSTPATLIATESTKQIIQDKTDQDLTVPTSRVTDSLTELLENNPVTMKGWNLLQVLIHQAVAKGLPANMVVLLLLFPVIATIIAFSHYVIGIKSFGVYTPAVLAVALISLRVLPGALIFLIVLFSALFIKTLLRSLPIPSLSKTSITLWGVSLIVLFISLVLTYFGFSIFLSVGIFPLLILTLLSENFTDSQFFTNTRTALKQTASTLILAGICAFPMRFTLVQRFVITNPEITIIFTLLINIIIGRYHGLRWLERIRFKGVLKEK